MSVKARTRPAVVVGSLLLAVAVVMGGSSAWAQSPPGRALDCSGVPSHDALKKAVTDVVDASGNGGLSNEMWATVVNRDGTVCEVAYSGANRGSQWPGSRVISAQKAHTANAFSLPPGAGGLFPGLSLSTANLYSAVQPGGSLFGLQHSNPVDPRAYDGNQSLAGQDNDPMTGKKIGGVNVFGGGLAMYNSETIVGGLGVSGDTSCTDHIVAWKIRDALALDHTPNGLNPPLKGDNTIPDTTSKSLFGGAGNIGTALYLSPTGFGHPDCDVIATAVAQALPFTNPLGRASGGGLKPLSAKKRATAADQAAQGVDRLVKRLKQVGKLGGR